MFTVVFKAYKGKLEKDIETSMPEWSSARSGILVQIFCGEDKKYLQEYSRIVKESLPDAKVIGATTDGEIAGKEVTAKRSVVSITIFEHTEVRTTFSESGDSYTDGRRLSSICDKNTKLLLILSDGTYSNGEDILYGVHSLAPEVMIGGGMAGDNSTFTQTWVLHEDRLISHGAVGASLNSDLLKVRNFYYFDWLPVDRKFKITKAVGNRVYTIDHIPAVELYRRYFGDKTAERLPKVGIEFPLMVQRGSMQVARAVLGKRGRLVDTCRQCERGRGGEIWLRKLGRNHKKHIQCLGAGKRYGCTDILHILMHGQKEIHILRYPSRNTTICLYGSYRRLLYIRRVLSSRG